MQAAPRPSQYRAATTIADRRQFSNHHLVGSRIHRAGQRRGTRCGPSCSRSSPLPWSQAVEQPYRSEVPPPGHGHLPARRCVAADRDFAASRRVPQTGSLSELPGRTRPRASTACGTGVQRQQGDATPLTYHRRTHQAARVDGLLPLAVRDRSAAASWKASPSFGRPRPGTSRGRTARTPTRARWFPSGSATNRLACAQQGRDGADDVRSPKRRLARRSGSPSRRAGQAYQGQTSSTSISADDQPTWRITAPITKMSTQERCPLTTRAPRGFPISPPDTVTRIPRGHSISQQIATLDL